MCPQKVSIFYAFAVFGDFVFHQVGDFNLLSSLRSLDTWCKKKGSKKLNWEKKVSWVLLICDFRNSIDLNKVFCWKSCFVALFVLWGSVISVVSNRNSCLELFDRIPVSIRPGFHGTNFHFTVPRKKERKLKVKWKEKKCHFSFSFAEIRSCSPSKASDMETSDFIIHSFVEYDSKFWLNLGHHRPTFSLSLST